jgi:hypothetical protein
MKPKFSFSKALFKSSLTHKILKPTVATKPKHLKHVRAPGKPKFMEDKPLKKSAIRQEKMREKHKTIINKRSSTKCCTTIQTQL